MIENAFVESVDAGRARVRLIRPDACAKCKVCFSLKKEEASFEAENTIGASPGDTAKVEIDDALIAKTTLMFYGVPFLGFITGILTGHFFFTKVFRVSYPEIGTLFLAFAAALLFYFLNRKLVKSLADNADIKIISLTDKR